MNEKIIQFLSFLNIVSFIRWTHSDEGYTCSSDCEKTLIHIKIIRHNFM